MPNYRVNPIITKVGLISINFIWSYINFSKPGMKNFKAGRKLKKNSKLQYGMQEASWNSSRRMQEVNFAMHSFSLS